MKLRVRFPNAEQREFPGGGEPPVGGCLVLDSGAWTVTKSESVEDGGTEWTVDVSVELAEPTRRFWKTLSTREWHLVYEYLDGTGVHRARAYRTPEGPYAVTGVEGTFASESDAKAQAERICKVEDDLRRVAQAQ